MLVLRRKMGQTVCVGTDIEVIILDVSPTLEIKLGFIAPDEINIVRQELLIYNKKRLKDGSIVDNYQAQE